MVSSPTATRPALWTPGDWNAFFGFGTNILVNLLVLTGLLRFVLKMPDEIVFGRILPAAGLMMCLSTMYYARLAYKLAQSSGRSDVCALPSGISVPHMFVVVFVIMMPIALGLLWFELWFLTSLFIVEEIRPMAIGLDEPPGGFPGSSANVGSQVPAGARG